MDAPARDATPARRTRARTAPSGGWRVIAGKELADNLLSIRFFVLLVVLGLAAVAAVSTAASAIRNAASAASGSPSPFLLLFTSSPGQIPSFVALIGFLGPLVGIAFAFDAINNERSQRTLPRLVSQPVHRDDVINGKFAAGLAVVSVTLVAVTAIVAGVGILRLGITPSPEDVARLLVYLVLAVVYLGVWMAFAMLCSVTMRRAATSALVALGVWLILSLFGALLAGLLADVIAPVGANPTVAEQVHNVQTEHAFSLISPMSLYTESTAALLNPQVRAVGLVLPQQTDQAVASSLPLGQSVLVVWPQIVALVAACVVVFAIAYAVFLRQEVRA
jgi:ABC-2 type transport system permease protein